MRKSILSITNELNEQLFKVGKLVDLIENKERSSLIKFRDWLYETEEIMKKYNIPHGSFLSSNRAQLANFLPEKETNKKKQLFHFTANLLVEAQETIWRSNSLNSQKIESSTELLSQLLNYVYHSKAFIFDANQCFSSFLETIWSFMNTNEQLKEMAIQVTSQISKADALRIIAEEINLEELK